MSASTPADGTVPDGPGLCITSVATGDVDGDGLEDLLVVTTEGSRVLKRMASADRGVADFSLDPKKSFEPRRPDRCVRLVRHCGSEAPNV